jgi:hypothetical protein
MAMDEPSPPTPQDVHRMSRPSPAMPKGKLCIICASAPTATVTLRAITGIAVIYTITTMRGALCANCGLYYFRRLTTRMLVGGLFSIIPIVAGPFFMLWNLTQRAKIIKLGPPQRHPHATNAPPPLDPGRPVFRRPGAYITPAIVLVVLIAILLQT